MKNLLLIPLILFAFAVFLPARSMSEELMQTQSELETEEEVDEIGVAVSVARISVTEKLKAGLIKDLPPITVINNGNVPAKYSLHVAYHEGQPELMPLTDWFTFTPNDFLLQPDSASIVDIRLTLPIDAAPGEYFAYLEAQPDVTGEAGDTRVNIAAATRLYFTIEADGIAGIYYRLLSLWNLNQPWTTIGGVLLIVILLLLALKKFFKISLAVERRKENRLQASQSDPTP